MKKQIYFIPLGGCGEIGMNLSLYGVKSGNTTKWIMVDCGITFAKDIPGIDIIFPDIEFIKEKINDLTAIIITHAHEDHIGALPYLWSQLRAPIYLTNFAFEILKNKVEKDATILDHVNIVEAKKYKIEFFDVEFVFLTHSIPQSMGLFLRYENYTIFHTGDWKIDTNPSVGDPIDKAHIKKISDDNIDLMVCDSTNVFTEGSSGTEISVRDSLEKIIGKCKQAVAVTTFASNVGRLVSILEIAKKHDRKICLLGRSMNTMIRAATASFGIDEYDFVSEKQVKNFDKSDILFLCTGSQGEENAALNKIANGTNKYCSLTKGDTVIFSSKKIPGNEVPIYNIINKLTDTGIEIIIDEDEYIHVSGHPCRGELLEMYKLVRPKHIIPVHGEARHLEEHVKLAKSQKIKALSIRNGDVIELLPKPKKIDTVKSGRLFLDGKKVIAHDDTALLERGKLAYAGIMVVSLIIDKDGSLSHYPEYVFRGINNESIVKVMDKDFLDIFMNDVDGFLCEESEIEEKELVNFAMRLFKRALGKEWGKKPMIEVIINYL